MDMAGADSTSRHTPNAGDNNGSSSAKPSTDRIKSFKSSIYQLKSASPVHLMDENTQKQLSYLKPPHNDDLTTSYPSSEDDDSSRFKKNQKKRLVEDNRHFRDWKDREQYIRRQYKRDDGPEARNIHGDMAEVDSDGMKNKSSGRRMSGAYTGKRLKSQPDNSASGKLKHFVSRIWDRSKAVTSSVMPKPRKEKKLKDVKTRRDTPYPVTMPARPMIGPTTQGLPPTPSKITLRKPSEPNTSFGPTISIAEERMIDTHKIPASNSITFSSTITPAYSITSSLRPLPPTPNRVFAESTTASVDQRKDDESDKYTTPPVEPQTSDQAKRASLPRSLSDSSLGNLTRSSTRRISDGSENLMIMRNAVHDSLWKNRSSLLITDASHISAKRGDPEYHSQIALTTFPTFSYVPFSLLKPRKDNTDTSSQSSQCNSTQEEAQTKHIDQLDGSREPGIFVFDTQQVDPSSQMVRFDRKVEKVNLDRDYPAHKLNEVGKGSVKSKRGGDTDPGKQVQLGPRPLLRSMQTTPTRAASFPQVLSDRGVISKSHRLQKKASLLSLPLHKYLDLALNLIEDNEGVEIPMRWRMQSVPKDIGSSIHTSLANFPAITSIQSSPSLIEEQQEALNVDGHQSSEQLSTHLS